MKTRYRPATVADTRAINEVGERSFDDLALRFGWSDTPIDADGIEREYQAQRSLYHHLAATGDQFWVAERQGRIVGVARSIVRGPLRELTELFVLPEAQETGIGTELLRRAFPVKPSETRCILATPDLAALARYLKAGLTIRFPNYAFARPPRDAPLPSDLDVEPLTLSEAMLDALDRIDDAVLGHRRSVDHRWLLADRSGWLYRRRGRVVGYGYAGRQSGPFALLDPADFPAVLADAEAAVAREGHDPFSVVVPMVNESAIRHLLGRGFRLDPFFSYLMSDVPFGRFEQYIETTPTFFL
ncbi:MAG TPA: GNAT family N-acetyltransferase [Nitrolancea sp.]|nr:GNAT family N-acetyltransferase [Nitrolancea sp.]